MLCVVCCVLLTEHFTVPHLFFNISSSPRCVSRPTNILHWRCFNSSSIHPLLNPKRMSSRRAMYKPIQDAINRESPEYLQTLQANKELEKAYLSLSS